jgi:hypothetical protein
VLPAYLQQLAIQSADAVSLAPVTRLQPKQLRYFEVQVDFIQQQLLLQLTQLPALQHLKLVYNCQGRAGEAAAADASSWALLPQLRDLVIDVDFDDVCASAAILAGISAATSSPT